MKQLPWKPWLWFPWQPGFHTSRRKGTTVNSADGLILPGAAFCRPRDLQASRGARVRRSRVGVLYRQALVGAVTFAGTHACHGGWGHQPDALEGSGSQFPLSFFSVFIFSCFVGAASSQQVGLSWGKRFLKMLSLKQTACRT